MCMLVNSRHSCHMDAHGYFYLPYITFDKYCVNSDERGSEVIVKGDVHNLDPDNFTIN